MHSEGILSWKLHYRRGHLVAEFSDRNTMAGLNLKTHSNLMKLASYVESNVSLSWEFDY